MNGSAACFWRAGLALVALLTQGYAQARPLRQVVVVRCGAGEAYAAMGPQQRSIVRARDGNYWLLLAHHVDADAGKGRKRSDRLELWCSADGTQWAKGTEVPMPDSGSGSLVADPAQPQIALVWQSSALQQGIASVYSQVFDAAQRLWLGEPLLVAKGASEEDQYFANDLDRTADGSLVAAIGSHRNPPQPAWNCGWSTALSVLRPQDRAWSPLQQINVASYGVGGGIHARGSMVHMCYRTCPDEAIIGLRSYDVAKGAFVQAKDEQVSLPLEQPLGIANTCVPMIDALGGRYVLYVVGDHNPGKGRLCIGYAEDAAAAWRTLELATDAACIRGNENYASFTMARGPGNQVHAFYSKTAEASAVLYQRVLDHGELIGDERAVANGAAGAYLAVTGIRQPELRTGVLVVSTSRTEQDPGGAICVLGNLPAPALPRTPERENPR